MDSAYMDSTMRNPHEHPTHQLTAAIPAQPQLSSVRRGFAVAHASPAGLKASASHATLPPPAAHHVIAHKSSVAGGAGTAPALPHKPLAPTVLLVSPVKAASTAAAAQRTTPTTAPSNPRQQAWGHHHHAASLAGASKGDSHRRRVLPAAAAAGIGIAQGRFSERVATDVAGSSRRVGPEDGGDTRRAAGRRGDEQPSQEGLGRGRPSRTEDAAATAATAAAGRCSSHSGRISHCFSRRCAGRSSAILQHECGPVGVESGPTPLVDRGGGPGGGGGDRRRIFDRR